MKNVDTIFTGYDSSIVKKNDGTYWGFGYNYYKQLDKDQGKKILKPIELKEF